MARRELDRIRRAVLEGRYEVTEHALLEAEADVFDAGDVRHALLGGILERTYSHDPRGVRYLVRGPSRDGRAMDIVCRFTPLHDLRIITVFAHEEEP
jgi:hypothetical protein